MNEFLEKLADILEEDVVVKEEILKDFDEWDSLSALSIIAMIDADYGVTVFSEDLDKFSTIEDLFAHLELNKSE